MILADTSVWIEHLRHGSPRLRSLLEDQVVAGHPFVTGEIALGHLRQRALVLSLLAELPTAPAASHEEALTFVEKHGLAGAGVGWVDVQLLCSVSLGGLRLWTLDRRLGGLARRLGLAA